MKQQAWTLIVMSCVLLLAVGFGLFLKGSRNLTTGIPSTAVPIDMQWQFSDAQPWREGMDFLMFCNDDPEPRVIPPEAVMGGKIRVYFDPGVYTCKIGPRYEGQIGPFSNKIVIDTSQVDRQ